MSDSSRAAFLQARKCWPGSGQEARIPEAARSIYDSWTAVTADARRRALEAAVADGLTRIQGRVNEKAQCRNLTLFGSPLPSSHAALSTLTLTQVEALAVVLPSRLVRPRNHGGHHFPHPVRGWRQQFSAGLGPWTKPFSQAGGRRALASPRRPSRAL
jgi:hypothetical protein